MNLYGLSGILAAITSGLMAILMIVVGRQKLHKMWALFCLSVFIFGFGVYFVSVSQTPEAAQFWWRFAHVGAIFIPVLFLHFVYEFLSIQRTKELTFFYLLSTFFLVTDWVGGYFIYEMRYVFNQFYYDSPPGTYYPLYTFVFFSLTTYSHYVLYVGYKQATDILTKQRIKYFFIATVLGFSGGAFNFPPVYGVDIYPAMNITVCLYPLIMSYAILKHKLFNLKLVASELMVVIMGLMFLFQVLTSKTSADFIINSLFFVGIIAISTYLIISIKSDIKSKEIIEEKEAKLEKVLSKLKFANAKLVELDKHKSDFVSIAAHQLRTPSGVIKNYSSMLRSGMYGELSDTVREPIDRIFENGNLLAETISAILDISHIESGKKVEFVKTDLKEMITQDFATFESNAKKKGLTLSFEAKEGGNYTVMADVDKLKHVFMNLIDNAIKYTDTGSVSVSVFERDKNVCVKVSDTGRGMSKKFIETQLYQKFAREESVTKNITGNGLGMYFVKEVVEIHQGVIEVDAQEGKGSTFTIVLPREIKVTKKKKKTEDEQLEELANLATE